jgi:hypothetical protein
MLRVGSPCRPVPKSGNISALLSDNHPHEPAWLLYIHAEQRIVRPMKQIFFTFSIALLVGLGGPASAAECYADYKAKQDNPLRLHYGVAKVTGPCTKAGARAELAQRLGARGWVLLNVVSVFGPEGLSQRKDSAGSNFLRF